MRGSRRRQKALENEPTNPAGTHSTTMRRQTDRFTFDEGQHTFRVNGVVYPGVTALILRHSDLIDPDQIDYYREEAMWRGTRVHRACAEIDLGSFSGEALVTDAPYIESYMKWLHLARPKWTLIEEPRYSRRYRFAGIPDRDGFDAKGNPFLPDLKTGVRHRWHSVQTALYDILLDNIRWGVRRRAGLYLQASGACARIFEHDNRADYATAFGILRRAGS